MSFPMSKPFHEGETAVQERYGIRQHIEQVGSAVIRDAMPVQHREFFARLPLMWSAPEYASRLDGTGAWPAPNR